MVFTYSDIILKASNQVWLHDYQTFLIIPVSLSFILTYQSNLTIYGGVTSLKTFTAIEIIPNDDHVPKLA